MKNHQDLFFELIRISIGRQSVFSRIPSKQEWSALYQIANKQSLIGVCFAGLQRLGANADDGFANIGLDEMQYLTWMGLAAKIQQKNEIVNRHCSEIQSILAKEGFRNCILKGQGIALAYGESLRLLRQSGDIDVWIDGGFEKINAWVQKVAPTKVVNQHHIDLEVFDDTEVEVHYHPINMMNPWRQKVLKSYIEEHENECLSDINAGTIHVPSREFNLVFLLVHIFHHLFTEGVGLRQIMDYYFVLKTDGNNAKILKTVHELGLDRFASAVMWILGYVFGLQYEYMPWEPCEKDGRFLLNEIMLSGNFGKQDERQQGLYNSKWNSFWMVHMKTFRFWRFDHWAWFWSPVKRISGYAWRRIHGYRQC